MLWCWQMMTQGSDRCWQMMTQGSDRCWQMMTNHQGWQTLTDNNQVSLLCVKSNSTLVLSIHTSYRNMSIKMSPAIFPELCVVCCMLVEDSYQGVGHYVYIGWWVTGTPLLLGSQSCWLSISSRGWLMVGMYLTIPQALGNKVLCDWVSSHTTVMPYLVNTPVSKRNLNDVGSILLILFWYWHFYRV